MKKLLSPIGVAMLFATNGAAFASILPWYPTLARQWQLSEVFFGLIVACFAAGSLASTVLPSVLVSRFGPIPVFTVGTVGLAVLVAGVGWSGSGLMLALFLLLFGAVDAIVDVGQNVAAMRVQLHLKVSIISSMHACWSLGSVLGGAVATAAAVNGVDIRLHLGLVAVAVIITALIGVRLIDAPPAAAEVPGASQRTGPLWAVLWLAAPVALVATAGTVVEDVANNWASLAAVELAGAEVGAAGLAFTITLAAQCIGRFSGDVLIQRFGRVAIARLGGVLLTAGGVLIVSASGWGQLAPGLLAAGFGCATLVPSAYAAAAQLPGLPEGAGVTAVSWLMRVGFLATSPVIGALATLSSLRWALGLLVVMGVLVMFCARALRAPMR